MVNEERYDVPANAWGRWGPDDERGAANLIDQAAVRRGSATVRSGDVVSLALPMRAGFGSTAVGRQPLQHFMTRDGGDYRAGDRERPGFGFADDYVLLGTHGGTHIDALAHIWQDGLMYNGFPASAVTSRGASVCGIERVGPIVTRGLVVDLVPASQPYLAPGQLIGVEALRRAVRQTGVEIMPGDALLVRTGWSDAWLCGAADTEAWPGLDLDCAEWIVERGIALVGADNVAVEGFPSSDPSCQAPLHVELIRNHGIYLCELMSLTEICARGRPDFLFVASPLPLSRAVGSPINPVAVL